MQLEVKHQIRERASVYMAEKKLSQENLAELASVNLSYVNSILNGKYSLAPANKEDGGKETVIGDQWFARIAKVVGIEVEKEYWRTVMTLQMKELLDGLAYAKRTGLTTTLICKSGMGKTYVVNRFLRENPKHSYLITINSLMKLHDVINSLCNKLGVPEKGSQAVRMSAIIIRLRDIQRGGGFPLLIFDEGENMEQSLVKMLKGLYDGISGYASIALLGTPQLLAKLERLKNSDRVAGPQFYRRFKAGIRRVSDRVDFDAFFNAFVEEKGLRRLLMHQCDNYGELHDYLEPALREADAAGVALTEDFFRVLYNMPR